MALPQLIVDLAVMLSMAALITIVFKKFRIPVILGYILTGFIIGPHFPLFLDIESTASVETWSEIGVIVILFHIGLEFDFHKIANIGSTAIVSALVKIAGVLITGYAFGRLLGLSQINSVFLGAMLSISSTVVIQKCFEEQGIEGERFTKLVMGSLVMEDVISIFIIVILTTVSVSKNADSGEVIIHLALMLCYLAVWLVLGIYIVPTVLDRAIGFMNDETLTVFSLGTCFLMAYIASMLGFSGELGAFLAGSFFAGTSHVDRIEKTTKGIKDMFGAVFFLSVGTMVDPQIIAEKWMAIIPIAIVAVVAKLIFAMVGMILSGQDLETAIRAGTSLAPIGEFSFIIASLGISLGVMHEYLYPVIVAASIITIICTPSLIRNSDKLVKAMNFVLPDRLLLLLENFTSSDQSDEEQTSEWKTVISDYALKMVIYGSIMLVTAIAGCRLIEPLLERNLLTASAAKVATAVLIYAVMAIFARPFLGFRSISFTSLWLERFANRPPLVVMGLSKVAVIIAIAYIPLASMFRVDPWIAVIFTMIALAVLVRLDFVSTYYLQLESRFLANLNNTTMEEELCEDPEARWLNEDYSIFSWVVPDDAPYKGKSLTDLAWGRDYGVYAVKLRRDNRNTAMPPGNTVVKAGDKIYVIGDAQSLTVFYRTLGLGEIEHLRTLKEFFDAGYPDEAHALGCVAIKVRGIEAYAGRSIKTSGIREKSRCIILGIQKKGYAITMPDANTLIEKGDVLWVIGTDSTLIRLASHSFGKSGVHDERRN